MKERQLYSNKVLRCIFLTLHIAVHFLAIPHMKVTKHNYHMTYNFRNFYIKNIGHQYRRNIIHEQHLLGDIGGQR